MLCLCLYILGAISERCRNPSSFHGKGLDDPNPRIFDKEFNVTSQISMEQTYVCLPIDRESPRLLTRFLYQVHVCIR